MHAQACGFVPFTRAQYWLIGHPQLPPHMVLGWPYMSQQVAEGAALHGEQRGATWQECKHANH